MREDYHKFCELIAFDATYKTNDYLLPLVLLMGVNNHLATVLFGGCLMRDETTASYVWLLTTFMECMGITKPPPLVITDSDKAMIAAIREVFGDDTLHRCCSWHIRCNYQSHCSKAPEEFKAVFEDCMTNIKTEEEFEERWWNGIETYGLEDNEWLQHMYQHRHLWVEHFFTPVFSAAQNTTQRCKSLNAYLKRFTDKTLKLYYFMVCYDEAVASLRENELEADVLCKYTSPAPTRGYEQLKWMEESAGKLYTRAVFKKVQSQIRQHLAYVGHLDFIDASGTKRYSVYVPGQSGAPRVVFWNCDTQIARCSCNYSVEMGIPCRHILYVLKHEGLRRIPKSLVPKRWTMDAHNVELPVTYTPTDMGKFSGANVDIRRVSRIDILDRIWAKLRDSASRSDAGFEEVVKEIGRLQIVCDEFVQIAATNTTSTTPEQPHHSQCPNIVKDPHVVATKGSAARPSGKEKGDGKSDRHCSLCGDTSHNKRKCSQNKESQHQGSQHQGYQHQGSQHQGYQHQGSQHQGSQHQGYQHQGSQHRGSQHLGSQPQGSQYQRSHQHQSSNFFHPSSSEAHGPYGYYQDHDPYHENPFGRNYSTPHCSQGSYQHQDLNFYTGTSSAYSEEHTETHGSQDA